MRWLVGNRQALQDQRDALNKLEGYPKRPFFVGSAIRHLVPEVYAPGAIGWSANIAGVEDEFDEQGLPTGRQKIEIPADVVEKYQGREVDLGGGRRVVIDLRGAAPIDPPGQGGQGAPNGGAKR